ncbi:DUF3301 domain-containing protein [Beggiatoa alba]|nr:DUF3301 domain-containing protein [Beggiatoa alba]
MTVTEFFILLFLVGVIFYWINTVRTKEIACMHGKAACQKVAVTFLDETVEIKKVRLKRNNQGNVVFYREYRFEFSSDGIRRFEAEIIMLGNQLFDLKMSAYPETMVAKPSDLEAGESQADAAKCVVKKDAVTIESNVVDINVAKSRKKNSFPSGYR